MIRLLAVVLMFLPWHALAQEIFPALYDVTGVASDDVLNVRAAPGASAEMIGSLAPDATGIEVVALSDDGAWGRVNTGEASGWTAMRFLVRQPGQGADDWSTGLAPATIDCFGTEPFWTLTLRPGGTLAYSALGHADGATRPGGYEPLSPTASTGKRGFFGWLETEPLGLTGIIGHGTCSDGMSDRLYGLEIDLIVSDGDGDRIATGCCRLRP